MAREMNNYTRWLVSFYWKLTRSFYREEDDNDHHHIVLYSSRGGNEVNYVAQFDFKHLCKCKKM